MWHMLWEASLNHRVHRLRASTIYHRLLRCCVGIHGMRCTRGWRHKWVSSTGGRHNRSLRIVWSAIVVMLASVIILKIASDITLWHLLKVRHRRHIVNLVLKMRMRMIRHELGGMMLLLVRRKTEGNHWNRLIIRCMRYLRHKTRTIGINGRSSTSCC